MLEQILKRNYGRVVGLDLSWEATGWAIRDCTSPNIQFGALPAVGGSDIERLDTVLNGVLCKVDGGSLVIIEDFAFARGTRPISLVGWAIWCATLSGRTGF